MGLINRLGKVKGKSSYRITTEDVSEFMQYVNKFYGRGGIYQKFFRPNGATKQEQKKAIDEYLTKHKSSWGGGDSVDREFVRNIMLRNRGLQTWD